jgi:L-threonylcarbamoyladenylate synthase
MAGWASVSRLVDCSTAAGRAEGIEAAAAAIQRGELIVLPTDTVYGVGADAFTPAAVTALLEAKGRDRQMPPPVLVGSVRAANALIHELGGYGQDLIEEFWPGALTLVCHAGPTLAWDLGDTKGTVAVRMPFHRFALDLLRKTGPMAVSSANRTGEPPARTAQEAREQLGDAVAVYLDAGPSGDTQASTIIDLTGPVPRVLRWGAVSVERLRDVLGVLLEEEPIEEPVADPDDEKPAEEATADDKPADDATADDKPADDAPVDDKPVDDKPVDDKPVDDKPVDDKPANDKTANDKTADDRSVDDRSVDDMPVEGGPAGVEGEASRRGRSG